MHSLKFGLTIGTVSAFRQNAFDRFNRASTNMTKSFFELEAANARKDEAVGLQNVSFFGQQAKTELLSAESMSRTLHQDAATLKAAHDSLRALMVSELALIPGLISNETLLLNDGVVDFTNSFPNPDQYFNYLKSDPDFQDNDYDSERTLINNFANATV